MKNLLALLLITFSMQQAAAQNFFEDNQGIQVEENTGFFSSDPPRETTYVVEGVKINTLEEWEMLQSYPRGLEDGYQDGYCWGPEPCLPPITPIQTIPEVWEEDNYRGGYQRGFMLGRQSRENDNY